MTVFHKTRSAIRLMDCKRQRIYLLVVMTLFAHLAREAEGVATCCTGTRSCTLYELLCRAGRPNDTSGQIGRLNNDVAVGILTLGKRKVDERRVHYRLQQLLHGSRNQAAGILTVGKRFDGQAHRTRVHAEEDVNAPETLGMEAPQNYLMPTVPEFTAGLDTYEKR